MKESYIMISQFELKLLNRNLFYIFGNSDVDLTNHKPSHKAGLHPRKLYTKLLKHGSLQVKVINQKLIFYFLAEVT